jgi:hypothetical protein
LESFGSQVKAFGIRLKAYPIWLKAYPSLLEAYPSRLKAYPSCLEFRAPIAHAFARDFRTAVRAHIFFNIQHTLAILAMSEGRIANNWCTDQRKGPVDVHDLISKLPEGSALQGLGEVVGHHHPRGAVLYAYIPGGNPVRYKVIADVDVAGAFTARPSAIVLKKYRALIVLVDY